MLKDTEQKMKSSIVRRPRQVEAVLSDIENSPYEAIVTGDFNDTPMSYTYYRLRRGRRDSFVEAGKGFGATYTLLRHSGEGPERHSPSSGLSVFF